VTDDISSRLLRLPMFYELTEEQQERVADVFSEFARSLDPVDFHSERSRLTTEAQTRDNLDQSSIRIFDPRRTTTPLQKRAEKKVAILQSNYIPWKGYFDMIASVDEFILYDDVQYTRRDWRNRNKIKTPDGPQWITIPVSVKGRFFQSIRDTVIDDSSWSLQHWETIQRNYRRAPYYDEVAVVFEPIYRTTPSRFLSDVNQQFIIAICNYLGIPTTVTSSSSYELEDGRNERLVGLCEQAHATEYVSGPAAMDYLDETAFQQRGISVSWFDYSGYPEYPQLWGKFAHHVTILDLLFNCGSDSPSFMKHVRSPGKNCVTT
jgi:hypothetical protein